MRDAIDSVTRATAVLFEHDDQRVRDVGAALRCWLMQAPGPDVMSLDTLLALSPAWRTAAQRDARDAALVQLRERCFPQLQGRAAAHAIAVLITRYGTSAWRHHRSDRRRPDGPNGYAYDVLATGAPVPGVEHMRHLFPPLHQQVADAS